MASITTSRWMGAQWGNQSHEEGTDYKEAGTVKYDIWPDKYAVISRWVSWVWHITRWCIKPPPKIPSSIFISDPDNYGQLNPNRSCLFSQKELEGHHLLFPFDPWGYNLLCKAIIIHSVATTRLTCARTSLSSWSYLKFHDGGLSYPNKNPAIENGCTVWERGSIIAQVSACWGRATPATKRLDRGLRRMSRLIRNKTGTSSSNQLTTLSL